MAKPKTTNRKARRRPPKSRGATERALGAFADKAREQRARSLALKKQKCDELIALIERRRTRIAEDFYDIGIALRTILREKLYEAGGYGSFAALVERRRLMSRATAMRLVAIVDHVPRAQAIALGQEKSYALIGYTSATPEKDTAAELARTDANVNRKPLSRATVRDITAAARAKRDETRGKTRGTPAQRARAAQARDAQAKVRAALKKLGLPRPRVTTSSNGVRVELTFDEVDRIRA